MNQKRGLLIVFSGPSGVGKDSILKKVITSKGNLKLSISCTTRVPRDGEIDGKDYYFITKKEFMGMAAKGEMLEYACYCKNYYGTPLSKVKEELSRGNNVILEVEVKGAMQVMQKFPDAVSIFVVPPTLSDLRKRIKNRGTDAPEEIENRIFEAKREINMAKKYEYIIVNDVIDKCAENILKILEVEHMKSFRMKNIINEVLEK